MSTPTRAPTSFRSGACCTRCSPPDAPSRAPAGSKRSTRCSRSIRRTSPACAATCRQPLNRVVRRCLEKAPESRFQTARDLVFALENLAPGSETDAGVLAGGPGAPRPRNGGRDRRSSCAAGGGSGVVVDGSARPAPQEAAPRSPGARGRPGCWPCCRSRTSRVAARDILHRA